MNFIILLLVVSILFILLLIAEAFISLSGPKENFKNPERKITEFGTAGKKIKYMIIGDSTSAGQGADYEKGIAILTSRHLAKSYRVEMLNTSISGAQIKDLLKDQIPVVKEYKPDLLLIAVGANDVIRLANPWKVKRELDLMINQLLNIHLDMKIVLTASPDMGSVPRFPQPLREIMGRSTFVINKAFYSVIKKYNLTLAPIAEKTGPLFKKDPSLFAFDRFHPNEKGYMTWVPVLNEALDQAITVGD